MCVVKRKKKVIRDDNFKLVSLELFLICLRIYLMTSWIRLVTCSLPSSPLFHFFSLFPLSFSLSRDERIPLCSYFDRFLPLREEGEKREDRDRVKEERGI